MLTGCATAEHAAIAQDGQKVEATLKGNKARVLKDMAQPLRRTPILNGTGECFDYQRPINGKSVPFYVGFNRKGESTNAGYPDTCAEAMKMETCLPNHR